MGLQALPGQVSFIADPGGGWSRGINYVPYDILKMLQYAGAPVSVAITAVPPVA